MKNLKRGRLGLITMLSLCMGICGIAVFADQQSAQADTPLYIAKATEDWAADYTAMETWEDAVEIKMENVIVGTDSGCAPSYKAIWDTTSLYLQIKFQDVTKDNADQIEVGFHDGVSMNYYLVNYDGDWSTDHETTAMKGKLLASKELDGFRYMFVQLEMADKTLLKTGNSLSMNISYYDYTTTENGLELLARYSWSTNLAGNPDADKNLILEGTPDVITEEEIADRAAVAHAVELITQLNREITLADEEAITEARATYEGLTQTQKEMIPSRIIDILQSAQSTLENLRKEQQENASIMHVEMLLVALDREITLEDEQLVLEARAAYEALSAHLQSSISEDALNALTAAEETLNLLKNSSKTDDPGCSGTVAWGSVGFAILMLATATFAICKRKSI